MKLPIQASRQQAESRSRYALEDEAEKPVNTSVGGSRSRHGKRWDGEVNHQPKEEDYQRAARHFYDNTPSQNSAVVETVYRRPREYADLHELDGIPEIDRVPTAVGFHSMDSADEIVQAKSTASRYEYREPEPEPEPEAAFDPEAIQKDLEDAAKAKEEDEDTVDNDSRYGPLREEGQNAGSILRALYTDDSDSCPPVWKSFEEDDEKHDHEWMVAEAKRIHELNAVKIPDRMIIDFEKNRTTKAVQEDTEEEDNNKSSDSRKKSKKSGGPGKHWSFRKIAGAANGASAKSNSSQASTKASKSKLLRATKTKTATKSVSSGSKKTAKTAPVELSAGIALRKTAAIDGSRSLKSDGQSSKRTSGSNSMKSRQSTKRGSVLSRASKESLKPRAQQTETLVSKVIVEEPQGLGVLVKTGSATLSASASEENGNGPSVILDNAALEPEETSQPVTNPVNQQASLDETEAEETFVDDGGKPSDLLKEVTDWVIRGFDGFANLGFNQPTLALLDWGGVEKEMARLEADDPADNTKDGTKRKMHQSPSEGAAATAMVAEDSLLQPSKKVISKADIKARTVDERNRRFQEQEGRTRERPETREPETESSRSKTSQSRRSKDVMKSTLTGRPSTPTHVTEVMALTLDHAEGSEIKQASRKSSSRSEKAESETSTTRGLVSISIIDIPTSAFVTNESNEEEDGSVSILGLTKSSASKGKSKRSASKNKVSSRDRDTPSPVPSTKNRSSIFGKVRRNKQGDQQS